MPNSHWEILYPRAGVDLQTESFGQVPYSLLFLIKIQGGPILEWGTQHNVLCYCIAIYLKEVLVDHPDAIPDGILG